MVRTTQEVPFTQTSCHERGEEEGFLRFSVEPDEDNALSILNSIFIKGRNESSDIVSSALKDSWKRLLSSSLETEFRNISKEKADIEAITVFSDNLRQLLSRLAAWREKSSCHRSRF